MLDPMSSRDDEFERRLHEEQSEVEDLGHLFQTHSANLEIEDEPDTRPENT